MGRYNTDTMQTSYIEALTASGARIVDGMVRDFGDAPAEARSAADGSVVVPLADFGVLELSGPDAGEFLQGQLSCDVLGLAADRSTYGTYSTPKGRMLASFLLWRTPAGFRMLAPRSVLPGLRKRLQMYVLRSKVALTDRTEEHALIGAAGPDGEAGLARAGASVPAHVHDVAEAEAAQVLHVPGERFIVVVPIEHAAATWRALAAGLRAVGPDRWTWLDIVNGIVFVSVPIQDQLVPQMANMELIGAVNFRKGCYPGQEVVARTQYLGKLKRRMYLAHLAATPPPAVGDALYSDDTGDQANGIVVAAATAPTGDWDCLAVVQSASAEHSQVHLRALDGPLLDLRPLPYHLE
jgi:hypothetical protein